MIVSHFVICVNKYAAFLYTYNKMKYFIEFRLTNMTNCDIIILQYEIYCNMK